ncbi:MAG: site-specific integrase [Alphaproteobacteria bacterium]|nr:site-specific integrase [Alphaproteobacteria bacterium]
MPLKIVRRKDTGALTITGTVNLPDGSRRRIRARAQSDAPAIAREEAASLEARILRNAWHGERRGARSFAEAVESYLKAEPRRAATVRRLVRIVRALGDVPLSGVDQEAVDRVRDKALRPNPSSATVRAEIVTPVRAVLNHGYRRGWCEPPHFEIPRQPEGRIVFMLPVEADRLVAAAAPHIRPLLVFLLGTGARLSEALSLNWRDVDLVGGRAIFHPDLTKAGRRRIAELPPAVVAALAGIGPRNGSVFRWDTKPSKKGAVKRTSSYEPRDGSGGQIRTAWLGAMKRSGLDKTNPGLTPHSTRHTWATWHHAVHHDLLKLKVEGGWQSVGQVERYAHLMRAGHEEQIFAFWGIQARPRHDAERVRA